MKKKNRIIAFIVCTVLLFTSYGALFEVFAADNTTLAAGGSLASKTYTLDGNINLADQITVPAGATVRITGSGTITNMTHLKYTDTKGQNMFEVYGNLIIEADEGERIIIDQANRNGYTAVWNTSGTITLRRVTIINSGKADGSSSTGGALSCNNSSTQLILDDVIFEDNYGTGGAGVYIDTTGGAKTVTMSNVKFDNCGDGDSTVGKGGGIEVVGTNNATLTMNNVTFDNCNSAYGAGMYIDNTGGTKTVNMTGVKFINCGVDSPLSGYGGGIDILGSAVTNVTITNAEFSGCDAAVGAGIYFNNSNAGSTVRVYNSTFTNCRADDGAGIILSSNSAIGATLTVEGCTFNGCSSANGSGLYLMSGGKATVNVIKSIFENCTSYEKAGAGGGTIRTNGNGEWVATFSDCVFRNNYSYYSGGGIYWNAVNGNASLDIIDCQFLNNSTPTNSTSNRGGGLFLEGSNVSITGSSGTFTEAITTGSIPSGGITGTLIEGNTSRMGGGVAYKTVESVKITDDINVNLGSNIIIRNNNAMYGGGLSFLATVSSTNASALFRMIIDGTEITGNTATTNGGGIFMDKENDVTTDMKLDIKSGAVTSNTATNGSGGAISINGGNVEIGVLNCPSDHSHPVMNNNVSGGIGGGISISGGTTTMYCGEVINNTSTSNQESNNFAQTGANTEFTIAGGTFGAGVYIEKGSDFEDNRTGYAEEIFVNFYNYYDGKEWYVSTQKVILIGSTMCLPTESDLGAEFNRDGYGIHGWSTVPGVSDGCLLAGSSVIVTETVSYYSVWVKDGYTVTTNTGVNETGGNYNAPNTGNNYNIPFATSSPNVDGIKDSIYDNACVIRTEVGSASGSNGVCYIVNDGTGIYLYVEVTDNNIFDEYKHYTGTTANPKGDFVEFFIDFPNDHEDLIAAGKVTAETYRAYAGRTGENNHGCAGWIVAGPPNTSGRGIVSGWGMENYKEHIEYGSSWIGSGDTPANAGYLGYTGYTVELYVPFPTYVYSSLQNKAQDKMNTECIGVGFETKNVSNRSAYDSALIGNVSQAIRGSGNYSGQYYLRYDWLPDLYLTPDTKVTNPTSYEYTPEDQYLEFTTPMQSGKVFNGWTLSSNGGNWTAGSVSSPLNIANKYGNVTMTAQWTTKADGYYSVAYNLNGGTVSGNPVVFNEAFTVKAPTKEGYTFNGWINVHTGTNLGTAPSLTADKNYALYADWTGVTYTATFNANSGVITGSSQVQYTGQTAITLPTVTRDGYIFLGWVATDNAGNWEKGEKYVSGETGKYGNITLIALWAEGTSVVEFSFTCDDDSQGFILSVSGTPRDTSVDSITMDIIVKPGETVSLRLPIGDYIVETYDAASWRYTGKTLNIVFLSDTSYVFEMGDAGNDKWLNDQAYN